MHYVNGHLPNHLIIEWICKYHYMDLDQKHHKRKAGAQLAENEMQEVRKSCLTKSGHGSIPFNKRMCVRVENMSP